MSILHAESSALAFIHECQAASYSVGWQENDPDLTDSVAAILRKLTRKDMEPWRPDLSPLETHKAQFGTQKLLSAIESLER